MDLGTRKFPKSSLESRYRTTAAGGTAHITRKYPAKIGLQDDILFGPERWTTQMFYPLVHSKREHSALRPGGYGFTEADLADLPTEAKQEAA